MCKNLSKAEIDNLSDTARDFFYFLKSFGNKLKVCYFVNLLMFQDTIQSLNTVTCGIVQIYFYNNLFNLDVNSKIQNNKKLTKKKKTIKTLINELFVLDQDKKEKTIEQYIQEQNITIT